MKKGWFRYITGLFLILVWNIALFSFWSFFFLITWILILPMDFIYTKINKRTPEIRLELPYQVPKEKVAVGTIHIKESSFFPCQFEGKLWCEKKMTGEKNCQIFSFSLGDREERIDFRIESEEPCGIFFYRVTWKRYSPFRLFFCRGENSLANMIYFMPACYDIILPEKISTWMQKDRAIYSYGQNGYDFSESRGFREYQPGDDIRSIHWKLSFRYDTFMIKEGSLPIEDLLIFYVETAFIPVRESFASACGGLLEYIASLFLILNEQGKAFCCIWKDYDSNRMIRKESRNSQDTENILLEIMQSGFQNGLPEDEWVDENDGTCFISYGMEKEDKAIS